MKAFRGKLQRQRLERMQAKSPVLERIGLLCFIAGFCLPSGMIFLSIAIGFSEQLGVKPRYWLPIPCLALLGWMAAYLLPSFRKPKASNSGEESRDDTGHPRTRRQPHGACRF
jgi:hypothetical protein